MIYLRIVEILIMWIANLDSITFNYTKFDEILSIFDRVNKDFQPDDDVEEVLQKLKSDKERAQINNLNKIIELIEEWSHVLLFPSTQVVYLAEHLIETLDDADLYNHAHTRLNAVVFRILCKDFQNLAKNDTFLMCRFTNFILGYLKCKMPKILDFN